MEKWTDERIGAYKRYVEQDIADIKKLEQEYTELQSAARGKIERIARINSCKGNYEGELYLQGWEFKNGEWVQVHKTE
ncbi:hypothetical protein [Bacillus toyonensis]|uniref:hypothetical protein n=1 Tax=Bacillus toyonensis TaxID=155322 RepID=UPI000BF127A0|nr:hypothetical protein [Bacillus toyonensis]PEI49903.1 hypothetical protein CN631_15660 [Bacillus toyonensis]